MGKPKDRTRREFVRLAAGAALATAAGAARGATAAQQPAAAGSPAAGGQPAAGRPRIGCVSWNFHNLGAAIPAPTRPSRSSAPWASRVSS